MTLSADPERSVTVPLTATNQGGASSADYSGVPESVTFASGDTEKSFTFSATADDLDDDGESVKLGFGTLPDGVTAGTPDESVVTITDDDVPAGTVTLVLTPATVDESGTNNVSTVTATLASASSAVTTITVSVPGGSPVTLSSNRTLTIAHGATSSTGVVTITAVDDAVYTGDREVDVSGASSNDVGVTDPDDMTLTITDDEPEVTVSFGAATYTVAESDDSSTTETRENEVIVKVTLSADPERTVTIPITKANQDGATAEDYSGVPAYVTFESGDTSKTFTFAATADEVDDDGESVKLTFGNLPTGVNEGTTAEAVVSITDDEGESLVPPLDNPPGSVVVEDTTTTTVSFGSATYTAAEGSNVAITVTLSADPEREVIVPLTATNQDGASSADYSGVPESVTFASGDTEKSFTFTATADEVDDHGESVRLDFGTLPTDVTAGGTFTTTVSILQAGAADEPDPNIQVLFSSASYEATEGGADAQVTVLLNSAPQSTVDIPLTAAGANGATEDDWSGVPASLTFNAGDTSKTFTVIATDDDVEDDNEMVNLAFGTLPNGFETGNPGTATITLMNDDTEGTSDNDCPDAVWCAELELLEEGYAGAERIAVLGWHYKGNSNFGERATLTDSEFTYRGKDYKIITLWVTTRERHSSPCRSELALNIYRTVGLDKELNLFEDLDLFEDPQDGKGLKFIVDDILEIPITTERFPIRNGLRFMHRYFNTIFAGSTMKLRIEETEAPSSRSDALSESVPNEPRCVRAFSYPGQAPESGVVALQVEWLEPSFDGVEDYAPYWANADSYKVQWKKASESWDDAVSESWVSQRADVILDLTEGHEYSIRVIARNEFGESQPSEEVIGIPTEVIRPELSSATVNGNTLTLAFSEPLDESSVPEIVNFEVRASGAAVPVAGVTVGGNAVVLTLDEAVQPNDEVWVDYILPWRRQLACIQDVVGNIALSFWGQPATNDTPGAAQAQATNEVAPLTVELLDAPESHNGEDTFTFLVLFSESIATSETIVRDKAFEVTGGTVTQASRVDGRSDLWEITVDPDSDADVAITLLSDRACDTEGAICTGDERRLSNGLALLVLGPEVQQDPAPNTPATGAPSIMGTPRVGETLTVDTTGISDQDGLEEATFRYRWIAGGNDIAGSNGSSYTIAAEDEGLSIKVQVSFTDDAGNPEVLESLHTAVVVVHDENDQGGGQDDEDQGGDDQDGDGQDDQDDEDQGGDGLATLSLYATATSINEGETLRVRVERSGPSNIQIDSGLQCYDSSTGEYTNAAVRMGAGVTSKVITATYAVDDGKTSSNRTITCEFRSVYDGVEHHIGSPAIVIVAVKE